MTNEQHWDFEDLLRRLDGMQREKQFRPEEDLYLEASMAIKALISANKTLHRRTQTGEAEWASKLAKSEATADFRLSSSVASFRRMSAAFGEIKRIDEECRRAINTGTDRYGYHSVMDSRADGRTAEPGAVYANHYTSKTSGIVTTRPLDTVRIIVDELLYLRASNRGEWFKRLLPFWLGGDE